MLEKMRRSKAGWSFVDLEKLYKAFGFDKIEGGKHALFIHPELKYLRATVSRSSPLPIGYIQYAIKLIDKLKMEQGANDETRY